MIKLCKVNDTVFSVGERKMTKGKKITIWILAIVLAVIVGTVGTVYG